MINWKKALHNYLLKKKMNNMFDALNNANLRAPQYNKDVVDEIVAISILYKNETG